ncbi:MAG: single-stranded-DNA-specific exonuclease RecJ [Nitrospirales bacterium]|nr:single-stranded-DNA-specific exonuclease RecJ [Nitrospirales bacterium]
MARIQKQWLLRDVDASLTGGLAEALSISPITAAVLYGRGVVNPEQARSWLSPDTAVSHDPFLLPDMTHVVDRLHDAIVAREQICFYGDYDVDGMTAISLHLLFFRSAGARAVFYIPDRKTEGYGLNAQAIQQLARDGVSVLVTADCGTTSHEEVALAKQLGLDVIVTDHHQIQDRFPDVLAFLNPQRADSLYPFTGLCSGGLAYKVAEAYASRYGNDGPPVESYRDLVALATVADIVPLRDENRYLVAGGLAQMTTNPRPGVQALKQRMGVEKACTTGTVAFRLAPILNAAGRLAHAQMGVRLLLADSEQEASVLAGTLEQLNRQRREIEQAIFEEARLQVDEENPPPAIVVGSREWHGGVVGIVAARLVERFHCPAVVIAFDAYGVGRGSVRSIPGFDVCRALQESREWLESFGGHPAAAGLTLQEEALPAFCQQFQQAVETSLDESSQSPVLRVDAAVHLSDIHPGLLHEFDRLHPFGMGNPEPVLVATALTVLEKRVVGDNHLKLMVRHEGAAPIEGIGFRMGHFAQLGTCLQSPIDLAFIPEINHWKGLDRVQLRIKDLRRSQPLRHVPCQLPH